MFFTKLLKNFLIALGFLLIGFGIGMIIAENFQIEKTNYWLIIVCSLILGGFFTALGVAKKIPKKKEIEESEEIDLVEPLSAPEETEPSKESGSQEDGFH